MAEPARSPESEAQSDTYRRTTVARTATDLDRGSSHRHGTHSVPGPLMPDRCWVVPHGFLSCPFLCPAFPQRPALGPRFNRCSPRHLGD